MRFRLLYLEEKEVTKARNLTELKNLVGGAAGKPVEGEEERKHGLFFQISSVGAWSIFKKKLVDALGNFKSEPIDSVNLKFVSGRITLYVKYEKSIAKFYFTTKTVKEPEWIKEDVKDSKKETPSKVKPEDDSSDEKTNK